MADAVRVADETAPPESTLVLKSTVLPGTCRSLAVKHRLVFNPEFLTARTAVEDFAHPDSIVLGGPHVDDLAELYDRHFSAKILCMSWEEAELVKYTRNTFYALKVAWWNEVYDLCAAHGVDYKQVKDGVLASGWVNPMHCDVPGHDGRRGFGGACLPKDSEALVAHADACDVDLSILRAVLKSNRKYRPEGE